MKTLLLASSLALASALSVSGASADMIWDPAKDGSLVQAPPPANPANAAAAEADAGRYTIAKRIWNPAESEFETVMVGEGAPVGTSAIATHDGASGATRLMWDPAQDGRFVKVPLAE